MTKKWYEDPKKITATIACVAALSGAIVVAANYINLPEKVEANEGQIKGINEYIAEQRIQNELMQQIQQQQMQYYPYYQQPEYIEPPRRCYDTWTDGYEYEIDCYTGEWI